MVEFYAILGMDRLARNHALVNFQGNNVKIQASNQEEIVYHDQSKEQISLLYAYLTWKSIENGEEI